MAIADRSPQTRRHEEAGPTDALWLGLAQACALVPGVSRNGATLAAARLLAVHARRRQPPLTPRRAAGDRGCDGAEELAAQPPRDWMLRPERRSRPGRRRRSASTLVSGWLIRRVERDRSLLPYALYRVALAAAITMRRES